MEEKVKEKVSTFFEKYKKHIYQHGEILIHSDSNPSGILYITKGYVKQISLSRKGEEQLLTMYKPFTFFPLMWAINTIPNKYYFEASDIVEAYIAPKEEVLRFLKNEPDVLYDVIKRLFSGVSGLLTRIEYLMYGTAYEKVIFAILNIASRFGTATRDSKKMVLQTTHKEIASICALSKETISRQSHILQKKGLIINKKKMIIVNDLDKLEEELFYKNS